MRMLAEARDQYFATVEPLLHQQRTGVGALQVKSHLLLLMFEHSIRIIHQSCIEAAAVLLESNLHFSIHLAMLCLHQRDYLLQCLQWIVGCLFCSSQMLLIYSQDAW